MPRTIPFAQHIFKRLLQLNCQSIHGVPGDFFLRALDHVRPSGLKWIGNANELCAGYAADGYARVGSQLNRHRAAQGLTSSAAMVGAVFTTYGVRELSAINAIAGSYAESIPVVHLVSTPSRKAMRDGNARRPIHHTLTDGRMDVYADMAKYVTGAQASLYRIDSASEAAEAYDEALEKAVRLSKPVYVSLGSDMVEMSVASEILDRPLNLEPIVKDVAVDGELVDEILQNLEAAERPLVIADGLSYPFNLQAEVNGFVSATNIPAMSFTSGKGIVDEGLPSWSPALPNTTYYSRIADLVMICGPLLSDTNTARWTTIPSCQNTIMFNLDSVEIAGKKYEGVRSRDVLRALISKLKTRKIINQPAERKDNLVQTPIMREVPRPNDPIAQDDFWPVMSSYLRAEDTLLLANGTPLIGGRDLQLPPGCQVFASAVWNAIGSMLPAAQGMAAAKRDHKLPGRTILFEGDGSFQVTCQSISDIIRYKLDVTVFICNNLGYTYERWLNGMEAEYNDVPDWRYTEAASFFGANNNDSAYPIFSRRVETWGQLQEVLAEKAANDGRGLKIIDVLMDPKDVPEASKPGLLRASEALRSV